jgi:hypothetical protein
MQVQVFILLPRSVPAVTPTPSPSSLARGGPSPADSRPNQSSNHLNREPPLIQGRRTGGGRAQIWFRLGYLSGATSMRSCGLHSARAIRVAAGKRRRHVQVCLDQPVQAISIRRRRDQVRLERMAVDAAMRHPGPSAATLEPATTLAHLNLREWEDELSAPSPERGLPHQELE